MNYTIKWALPLFAKITSRFLALLLLLSVIAAPIIVNRSHAGGLQKGFSQRRIGELSAVITAHEGSLFEVERLKSKFGVGEADKNYNLLINGHGTGLKPPTEKQWKQIAANAHFVDIVSLDPKIQIPSSIDHSAGPWFPPIGNQDGEGSCTCFAVGYYTKTFQEAKEHGWNLTGADWLGGYYGYPTPEYQDKIFSPDFLYHLINWGFDYGSSFEDAIDVIAQIGAATWAKMPYDPRDHSRWPSEDAWKEAPFYRGHSNSYEYLELVSDEDILDLKNLLASGELAVIAIDASDYVRMTYSDLLTLDNFPNLNLNHANTVVGYDDTISYTEEGELRYGAFKIANSWGVGDWENVPDGFYWVSYEAMKQRVQWAIFFQDLIDYQPELVASFWIEHPRRSDCIVSVSMGDIAAPLAAKLFIPSLLGGSHPFCANNILLDITEFKSRVSTVQAQPFHLEVVKLGTLPAVIKSFAVEYVDSHETPLTVDGGIAYVNVSLIFNPLETSWAIPKQIYASSQAGSIKNSIAADKNGILYAAYENWLFDDERCGIQVDKSTDGGKTWLPFRNWNWTGYDCTNPQIAVDPYDDRIYVVYERALPTHLNHDIYCWVYSESQGENHVVVDGDSDNDRFPSVTCELGSSSSRVYIAYECITNYNDRDLMFAKSTDHGLTWLTRKLHGAGSDANVYAQPSVACAGESLYIAYKFGKDYESACSICVDKSADCGENWVQMLDVDSLPNGCSCPSVVAVPGCETVVVAFQYSSTAGNDDVFFSFSLDGGQNWIKGLPLSCSEVKNERLPSLRADKNGYVHAVYQEGNYLAYKKAHYMNLTSWSSRELVSDKWVGSSIAVAIQQIASRCYPCVVWSAFHKRTVYYSTQPLRWIVDDDGEADFHTIQEAINAASNGDVIFVRNGTYYENVVVNKSVTLVGENRYGTIIDGSQIGTVVSVNSNYVTITGFTVRNSGEISPSSGINILGATRCQITENCIVDNLGCGIRAEFSSNNFIYKNIISRNDVDGIGISGSSHNVIFENEITHNGWTGLSFFAFSNNNVAFLNNIDKNAEGICFIKNQNNTVYANNVTRNGRGIFAAFCSNIIFHNNFVSNAEYFAVQEASCVWDDGYPSGGNYWSSYMGADANHDGIGDAPYVFDANNSDNYPLMQMWGSGTPTVDFTWTPSRPAMEEEVTFDASITKPMGGIVTIYKWDFGDGNTLITTNPIVTHTFALNTTYNVTLTVEDTEGLANTTSKPVEIFRHDVSIVKIDASRTWVYQGHCVHVNVTVRNEGDYTEDFNLTLYCMVTLNMKVGRITNTLEPHAEATYMFVWNTTGFPYSSPLLKYTLAAHVICSSADNDLANNIKYDGHVEIRIMGDVNNDGSVNMFDLYMLSKSFGMCRGEEGWMEERDLNLDGYCNMIDLFLTAQNFGKTI